MRALARALRSGRLPAHPSATALHGYCTATQATWLSATLADLQADAQATAVFLDAIAAEKQRADELARAVDLVWTGPEVAGMQNRDTGAVTRELFSSATESVLIAGYAIYQGNDLFATLARRMEALPDLRVRFVVDIPREFGDTTFGPDLVYRYAANFKSNNWPGSRLPEVLYDPRSLELDPKKRSSMHAKVLVVDKKVALITSANFTQAAQTKNIEVGALVRMGAIATQVVEHFEALEAQGWLRQMVWPGANL
jgi:phosphatidylserine/phosphatidylglycerophosphate/cardiolipin synthase-like enzyme